MTYTMMVNLMNTVEVWWKDTNTTLPTNKSHPINEWTKSPVSIPGVHPSTSIGYTNYLYAQMNATNEIVGYNITWAAEKSSLQDHFGFVRNPGIPGTHLSVTALHEDSGGDSLLVFYQVAGDDITQFNRDLVGGQLTTAGPLDIPDD